VRASESALKSHLSGSEFGVRASACMDGKPLRCMAAADPDLVDQVASSASHKQFNKHIHTYQASVTLSMAEQLMIYILAMMYSRNAASNHVSC